MALKEYLEPQTSFSIDQLSQLRAKHFTERTVTFEYRRTNGAMIIARKGDHVANKLTQRGLAEAAHVPSRAINYIETMRGFPTPEVAKSIAEVLQVKKEHLFPAGLRAYERSISQPAKLRILLTGEETEKSIRLTEAFLKGTEALKEYIDNLLAEAEDKIDYFLEFYNKHGLTIPVDVMLVMDTPEILVAKSRALAELGKRKWALDLLNLTENRVVFMYNKIDRNRLAMVSRNPSFETDDPEIIRLRMIYGLEEEINKLPPLEPPKRRSTREPLASFI